MNLDALVKCGRLPWSPNPSAQDLDVWDEYEHPRVGTFSIDGNAVFFSAVAAFENRISVWAYTCLTSEEAQTFSKIEFDSVTDLQRFAEELFAGRKVAFAMADELLICNWSVADGKGPLHELAIDFLNKVLDGIKGRRDPSTMLRAKLAQVDVATTELVDA